MDPLLFANLVSHALQTAWLVAGASLLERALLKVHPGVRLGLFQAVLATTVVLPFVQHWQPTMATLDVRLSTAVADAAGGATTPRLVLPGLVLTAAVWAIGVGILGRLAWIVGGLWRLRRLECEAQPFDELPEPVWRAMHDARASARFLGSELAGPISFGLRRGIVLLPRRFRSVDSRSQYLIVYHELLHIRRGDALQCLLEELVAACFWFYPWTWWIRARIRLAREQVVDRATAAAGGGRDAYVRTLLGFAGRPLPSVPMAAGLWRARELRARIDALYWEVSMSRTRVAIAAATAIIAVVSLAAVGAASFPFRSAPISTPVPPSQVELKTTATYVTPLSPAAPRAAQEQSDDVVTIGGDVQPPRKTKHVNPIYPEDAKEARIQGVVIVETVINKEGKVANARVVKSVPELDQAALDAVLQWEFEPTYVKGKAVSVRMTVTINFTLA